MLSNRSTDTKPEVAVRSAFHRVGLRFRKHVAPAPGIRCRPDAVFPGPRVAFFLDGCFWHGCPQHWTAPKANAEFWQAKVTKNRARDERNTRELEAWGWTVVRAWEHEPVDAVVARVLETVRPTENFTG